jgi:LDH2 family malate/lactate/ureidoglycolate dehydrogenase
LGRAGYPRAQIPAYNNGLFVTVVDIKRFLALEEFTAGVRHLIAYIKSCPPAAGVSEIVYPGERAAQTRRYRQEHGIDVDLETCHLIRTIARKYDIQVPDSV